MYRQFDDAAVQALVGVMPDDAPGALLIHGVYNMPPAVQAWRDRLTHARTASRAFNIVIGEVDGVTVWYAAVLGAPMAAFAVHAAALLGARGIVQIGSYGGTKKGQNVGDLLIVTGAGRGDGASDWYLPPGERVAADGGLVERLRQRLAAQGLRWHEGEVFTTPAFMAETWDDILRWEREGYAGVEMEAAATLAIARHFDLPATALIYLLDNLIEERHILDNTADEADLIRDRRELISSIGLELVVELARGKQGTL